MILDFNSYFVIGHKSNDFRFMDYKSKIKIINHKSMNWLSNKLFYTIGITLLCGGLHAQSLAEAKKLYNEGKVRGSQTCL